MLILLVLIYTIPVYLIFFKFQWIRLTPVWWGVIMAPPVIAGLFLWFAIGRYTPLTSDAYVQAHVAQIAPQVNGPVTEILVTENQPVTKGLPLFRIDSLPYRYAADQAMAQLLSNQEQSAATLATMSASEQAMRMAEIQVTAAQKTLEASNAGVQAAKEVVRNARALADFAQKEVVRFEQLLASNSVSQSEYDNSKKNADSSAAQLAVALQQEQQAVAAAAQADSQVAAAVSAAWQARINFLRSKISIFPLSAIDAGIAQNNRFLSAPVENLETVNPLLGELPTTAMRDRKTENLLMESLRKRIAGRNDFLGPTLPGERIAQEAYNQAKVNLEQTTILSPVAGTVSNLQLSVGTYARSGTPVVSVIDHQKWWLVADFPENWLGLIKPGDKVLFSLRNYPGKVREATVTSVGRGVMAGQGLPNAMLADTQSRITRQYNTPLSEQRFPVILQISDDQPEMPLRVGATSRVVVFASGGFPVLNTVITIFFYVSSYLDYFFPKPSMLLILIVLGGLACWLILKNRRKNWESNIRTVSE